MLIRQAKRFFMSFLLALLMALSGATMAASGPSSHSPIAIVIHGGAGNIERKNIPPKLQAEYKAKLNQALQAGYSVLKKGGTSKQAVVSAISIMEDSPLFDSAKGAVLTHTGQVQLDAAIMDGKTQDVGSVGALQHVAHPIQLALKVLEDSPHVLLVGQGAEDFAIQQGMDMVPQSYFYTERSWNGLMQTLKQHGEYMPGLAGPAKGTSTGTVGTVALDRYGNIAAGTSTGGTNNKLYGRVGDSPLSGDGTYANNATCGESGTGVGEYYMRLNLTKEVSDRMALKGWSVKKAVNYEIHQKLTKFGGDETGGLIAMDKQGHIAIAFNTPGMFRGYIDTKGHRMVKLFRNE